MDGLKLKKLLNTDFSLMGPLSRVEEVVLPEPWPPISKSAARSYHGDRRGPKSFGEWQNEIRKAWGRIDDEEYLAQSWLASLRKVQDLAIDKYGGGSIGRGLALQEYLARAVSEAKKYDVDEKTRRILEQFPQFSITQIAVSFSLSREHFSRLYGTRAARLVTITFQRILDRYPKT